MAKCSYCGRTILLGGVVDRGERFCNSTCQTQGRRAAVLEQIHPDLIIQEVQKVHEGDCPKCGGPGPVDVHTSHTVYSFLLMTVWKSHPSICCRACGVRSQLLSLFTSGALGWWGFPWGIMITPIQVIRNVWGLVRGPDPSQPSPELHRCIATALADQFARLEANPGIADEPPNPEHG